MVGISVPPNSNSSITLDFAYQGTRCRERLKLPPTRENIAYANGLRAQIMREIGMGTFKYATHFPDSRMANRFGAAHRHAPTVAEALDQYLASLRKTHSPSTLAGYSSAIETHLKPKFGDRRIDSVTTTEIKAWINTLAVTNKTINSVLTPFRGMFSGAFYDQLIGVDPMARVKALENEQDEPDPFTPAEIEAILGACLGEDRNFFQFAFYSGARTGELIALEWQDVDFVNNCVRIRRSETNGHVKTTKTHAGQRDVRLLTPARSAIEAQRAMTALTSGRIFHNLRTGKPWHDSGEIKRAWDTILRRAGVRRRVPYQTRHTYASLLLSAGENPSWIANQMGHADWGMIRKVYARWMPDANPEAGNKIESILRTNHDAGTGNAGSRAG